MTRDKDFKRLVRARASATDEPYTKARQSLLRQGKESRMVRVTCEVNVETLSEERLTKLRKEWEVRNAKAIEEARDKNPNAIIKMPFSEQQGVIVLRELEGDREVSIWCGPHEATAIALGLQGVETQRPLTHDLLRDVVSAMGTASAVRVTDVRDGTFIAELVVTDKAGEEQTISCRPSDGVALAVRTEIPILVADALFALAK